MIVKKEESALHVVLWRSWRASGGRGIDYGLEA